MIFTICVPCKENIATFHTYYQEVKINLDKLKALLNMGSGNVDSSATKLKCYADQESKKVIEKPRTLKLEDFIQEPELLNEHEEYEIVEYENEEYEEIEILEEVEDDTEFDFKLPECLENPEDLEKRINKLKSQTSLTLYEKRRIFYEFNCFKCGSEFSEEHDLEHHQKERHKLQHTTYFCCLKERKVENANDHMKMHLLGSKFICYACGKSYSMIRRLRIHQNEQCNKSGRCPDCNEYLPAKELFKHFTKHSKEDKKNLNTSVKQTQNIFIPFSIPINMNSKELETIQKRVTLLRDNPNFTLYEKRKAFYTFKCYKCQTDFDDENNLELHQQNKHELNKVTYFCCNKERMEESANDHILYHIDPQQFRCYACGKSFSMTRRLRLHQKRACKKSGHCPTCNDYLSAKELFEHRLQHMKNLKKVSKEVIVPEKQTSTKKAQSEELNQTPKFQCDICERKFRRYTNLRTHILDIHLSSTIEVCKICGFSTKYRSSLDQHIRTQHHNAKKQQCSICGKYVKQLKVHIKMHHSEDDQPSSCETCRKVFKNQSRLKMHIKGAHGGKRYRCDQCGKEFRQKNYLNEHIHAHLGPDAGYLYQCDYCSHQCNYKHNLATHFQKNHPREWEEHMKARLQELYGDDLVPKTLEGNQDTSLKKVFDQSGLKINK